MSLLSGCGGGQSAASSNPAAAEGEPSQAVETAPMETDGNAVRENNGSIRAVVTAIEGNTVTARTMGMRDGDGPMGGGMPQEETAPTDRPEDAVKPSDLPEPEATPSDLPEGKDAGQGGGAPNGQAPGQNPDGGHSEPQGEEITITITSDMQLSLDANGETTEGSAEDIAAGCMIDITYGDDGETIEGITIYQTTDHMPEIKEAQ